MCIHKHTHTYQKQLLLGFYGGQNRALKKKKKTFFITDYSCNIRWKIFYTLCLTGVLTSIKSQGQMFLILVSVILGCIWQSVCGRCCVRYTIHTLYYKGPISPTTTTVGVKIKWGQKAIEHLQKTHYHSKKCVYVLYACVYATYPAQANKTALPIA